VAGWLIFNEILLVLAQKNYQSGVYIVKINFKLRDHGLMVRPADSADLIVITHVHFIRVRACVLDPVAPPKILALYPFLFIGSIYVLITWLEIDGPLLVAIKCFAQCSLDQKLVFGV
jgi:hypothetical protein